MTLATRTILVTGASAGLGARLSNVLAAQGANVVLAARRKERLMDHVRAIEREGGTALAVEMDVSDEGSVVAAYDEAEQSFGTIDGIIANAGISMSGAAVDQPIEDFDVTVQVNLRGAFLTLREGARRLVQSDTPGRAVVVSSITASQASPGLAAYSASKAAVLQMGRVLAREWVRKDINVNMILPGYIETDMNSEWFASDAGKRQISGFSRRRLMPAESVDGLILYLMSEASRHVTGSAITIDDGQSL